MIHIFQIGNVSLHFHDQTWPDDPYQVDVKGPTLIRSHINLWPNNQFLPRVRTIKRKGVVLSDSSWADHQQVQRLRTIAGMPTEIIGYMDIACNIGCGCEGNSACNVIWLTNYGVLKKVDTDQKVQNGLLNVDLEIEVGSYWQPLNRYLHIWQGSEINYLAAEAAPAPQNNLFPMFPTCDQIFASCNFWAKRPVTMLDAYNPDMWQYVGNNLTPEYPEFSKYLEATSGTFTKQYFIDASLWGAPPLSVYQLTSSVVTGTVTIQVEKTKNLAKATEVTTLNLATLHADLLAKTGVGLQATDKIYMGDVLHRPGFVVRDGAIIPDFFVDIAYEGFWPGALDPGDNRITVTQPAGVTTTWLHLFRRL